ncbi:MAG TPA: hypothetical protein VMM13_10965 [Euzebya sp.]|nr:hypothetical protein [Euzebya sp.]
MSTAVAERFDRIRVGVDVVVLSLAAAVDVADGALPTVQAYLWQEHPDVRRLPGVSVRPAENLEEAARRVLDDIGIADPRHLEQLASFGAPARVPGVRTLSVSYLALLPEPTPVADDGHAGGWLPVADVDPDGGFVWDHGQILVAGLQRIRSKLSYSTIAFGLLGDEFTMSELQAVYEAVLDTSLDKRNFRKRVTALQLLVDTGRLRRGSHRPARLYTFASPDLVVLDDVVLRTTGA